MSRIMSILRQCDPVGHAIQPAPQRTGRLQPAGLAEEHQKRCLEGILGVALIPEHASADRQDHLAVPRDQGKERRFVAPVEETFHKLSVGQAGERPFVEETLDLPQRHAGSCACHPTTSENERRPSAPQD
jgi:hypothetical protein